MNDRIGKLRTLDALRRRDVDRCTRELGEGLEALAEAEAERDAARRGCTAAAEQLQQALSERIDQPADANVALFCAIAEQRLAEAEQRVRETLEAFDCALEAVSSARRALVRAQVRLEALGGTLDIAERKDRRNWERRESDTSGDRRVPKGVFAWA
jgi:ribosome-binding ATPase YchF (GTP1/OBG family)